MKRLTRKKQERWKRLIEEIRKKYKSNLKDYANRMKKMPDSMLVIL